MRINIGDIHPFIYTVNDHVNKCSHILFQIGISGDIDISTTSGHQILDIHRASISIIECVRIDVIITIVTVSISAEIDFTSWQIFPSSCRILTETEVRKECHVNVFNIQCSYDIWGNCKNTTILQYHIRTTQNFPLFEE